MTPVFVGQLLESIPCLRCTLFNYVRVKGSKVILKVSVPSNILIQKKSDCKAFSYYSSSGGTLLKYLCTKEIKLASKF